MDKNETLSVIQLITTYFPNFKFKNETSEERGLILDAWHGVLRNYDVKEMAINVVEYAEYNSFPPKVADITQAHKSMNHVPNLEETRLMLQEQEQKTLLALEDPNREEAKAKAQAEIRKTLGIERG